MKISLVREITYVYVHSFALLASDKELACHVPFLNNHSRAFHVRVIVVHTQVTRKHSQKFVVSRHFTRVFCKLTSELYRMYNIICVPYNVYVYKRVYLLTYDAFLHSRCHQTNSLFVGQHHYLNRAMSMKELYML